MNLSVASHFSVGFFFVAFRLRGQPAYIQSKRLAHQATGQHHPNYIYDANMSAYAHARSDSYLSSGYCTLAVLDAPATNWVHP